MRVHDAREVFAAATTGGARALGFDDADFAHGLSDRLVDALVAWGTETQIRDRIEAQFRAGASHVCILPLDPAGGLVPCRRTLAALAPA